MTCWIARTTIFGALCTSIYITFGTAHNILSSNNSNGKHRALDRWTIYVLMSCSITAIVLLCTTFLPVCLYVMPLIGLFFGNARSAVTFYQICRLQYLFSQKQLTSIGFKRRIFVIFYTLGALPIIFQIVSAFSAPKDRNFDEHQCFPKASVNSIRFVAASVMIYLFWDLLVLAAYVIKMHELRNRSQHDIAIYKISVVLKKIIVLTILFECTYLFNVGLYITAQNNEKTAFADIFNQTKIIATLDILETIGIMYLMLGHNHTKYRKCVNCLKASHIFCCCQYVLVSDQESKMIEKEIDDKNHTTVPAGISGINTASTHSTGSDLILTVQLSDAMKKDRNTLNIPSNLTNETVGSSTVQTASTLPKLVDSVTSFDRSEIQNR